MTNILQLFTYVCTIFIIINAVIVVFKTIITLHSSTRRLQRHDECNCPCRFYATMQYAMPFNRTITLRRSLLSRKTLTRVGSDLDFDYNSCPANSFMLDPAKQNATPLHDDCPMLFIIGAHRAGTTSLYQYLVRHSNFRGIRVDKGPFSGETYHFTSRYNSESWERYKSRFPTSAQSGEKSIGMFHTCETPRWLYESCGRTSKVIVLLRNPTDRYRSAMGNKQPRQILFNLLSDIETYNEATQIHSNTDHNGCLNHVHLTKNHLYIGLYSLHLANWLCNFPSENILLLNSEEFRESPAEILQLVMDFINYAPYDDYKLNFVVNITYNEGRSREETGNDLHLINEVHKKLNNFYRTHNKHFFTILHWNNSTADWPT